MLAYELREELREILAWLGDENPFIEKLRELDRQFIALIPQLRSALAQKEQRRAYEENQKAKNHLDSVVKLVKSYKHSVFYEALSGLSGAVEKFQEVASFEESSTLAELPRLLLVLKDEYDEFLSDQVTVRAFDVLIKARALYSAIEGARSSLGFLQLCIDGPEVSLAEDESSLCLFFTSKGNLASCVMKLEGVLKIYEELCSLLKVNRDLYPLRCIRIQAGSLLLEIAAAAKAIHLMGVMFVSTARFLHEERLRNDRIEQASRKIEMFERMLTLRERLKEQEIDTDDLDEHIASSTIKLGESFSRIMKDEDAIEIDGERHVIRDDSTVKQIEDSDQRLLGNDIQNNGQ